MFKKTGQKEPTGLGGLVRATLIAFVTLLGLTSWAYFVDGTSAAIRIAAALVMPVGFAWAAAGVISLASLLSRCWSLAAIAGLFFVLVGLLGNVRVANWMIKTVEWPAEQAADLRLRDPSATTLDAVVVLGGSETETPGQVFEIGQDGERIFTAAQFWHQGASKTIIATGSSVSRTHPSVINVELLASVGVPDEVLFRSEGLNTVMEMSNLSKFLTDPPESFDTLVESSSLEVGLITSAFHMRRAMRLAESEGLGFVPLPVAYRQIDPRQIESYHVIPSVSDLDTSTRAIRECIAWLLGR